MSIEELLIILSKEKPSVELKKRKEELFSLIPELEACDGFNQNNPWHIYDVLEHIFSVVDLCKNNYISRLTALFHDIGKPICYKEDDEHIGHFYNHWDESKKIFHKFAIKNNLDEKSRAVIEKLIFYHDIRIRSLNEEDYNNLITAFNKDEMILLFDIKKADLLSQNPVHHHLLEDYEKDLKSILENYI